MKNVKRFISLALALAILAGFVYYVPSSASAADDTDAFGITMNVETDNNDLTDNPYGTDGWFSLFTKSELVETRTKKDTSRQQLVYRYDEDSIYEREQESSTTYDKGYSLISTVAFDPLGSGRDEYIANLAYKDSDNTLYLYITDGNGNVKASAEVEMNKFLHDANSYNATSHMAITAGDYDGDGKDTIVFYAPENLQLREYSYNDSSLQATNNNISISDALGDSGKYLETVMAAHTGGNSDELRATPSVSLTTDDTDKDGKDELVVTANWNDLPKDKYGDIDTTWQGSYVNVYDYGASGFTKTWSYVLEADQNVMAEGRLRFAGSSVGNVVVESGNVDYPEIITAGWVDQSSDTGCNIDEGKIGVFIFRYSDSSGTYVRVDTGLTIEPNEFATGGVWDSDKIQDPVCVVAYAARGLAYAEYIFIEGTVYSFDGASISKVYNDDYFDDDDDGIDRFAISQGGVQMAVAANFDGNEDGREQIVFTTVQKYKYGSGHFFRTWYYGCTGAFTDDDVDNPVF